MVWLPRWRTLLALSGALLFTTPAAAGTVSYKVEFQAPGNLVGVLQDNLDIVSWAGREDVNEEQIRQLVKTAPEQVRSLLATEGYFSPKVTVALDRSAPEWVVKVQVEPGEPVKIVSIDFRVTGAIDKDPEREKRVSAARKSFALQEGAIFRQADWDAGKEAAVHSLHRKRYAAARVTNSQAQIDPVSLQARLNVEIDSGPPFTFGKIEIRGLQRYQPKIVRNMSPIKPGDPYDEEELLKYQKRLLTSGRFASAVVSAGDNPDEAAATPVYVTVVESEARRIELGAGISTNRGLRGVIGYTDQNTFDRGLQFDAQLKVDQVSEELAAGLILPRDEKGWRYGFEGKYLQEDIQNDERTDWSVTGTHAYLVEEYRSQQSLQLLAENRTLEDGAEDHVLALYLAQNWTWNQLDSLLAAREGYFLSLEAGGASKDVVSDASFGRLLGRATYYQPVKTFGTLSARIEGGWVIAGSRNNIPGAYLFRTGGDNTVRGYAYQSLGVDQGGSVVGGRYLLVGSVEYTQWIGKDWGAAVFYDRGNANDDWTEFRTVAGYGVGVRWHSAIGALNLDLAYGEAVDEYRIHFTTGFVFR